MSNESALLFRDVILPGGNPARAADNIAPASLDVAVSGLRSDTNVETIPDCRVIIPGHTDALHVLESDEDPVA
jgi:hypothetical protein